MNKSLLLGNDRISEALAYAREALQIAKGNGLTYEVRQIEQHVEKQLPLNNFLEMYILIRVRITFGKTKLVQHWLQRLEREGWFAARRVYAWSFLSQGTKEDRQVSEDRFLVHALEWFGVRCEATLSPWDKGRLLADAVIRERTLLILDGIEPIQYPPGPMGGQLRAPGMQALMKRLARQANDSEHRGLCLVTTREPLTDLADFERRLDAAWGSVLRVDLGNLTDEAGAALLHHIGVKRAGAAPRTTSTRKPPFPGKTAGNGLSAWSHGFVSILGQVTTGCRRRRT